MAGEARAGIGLWIGFYNGARPHMAFAGRIPDAVYADRLVPEIIHSRGEQQQQQLLAA